MSYLARFEKHRYLLAWAFILLISVLGIRYGYGNDFYNYKYIFDNPLDEEAQNVEPGWFLLNKLFRPFGFSTFVFFLTVIEQLMLYDIIRRYVPPQYFWFAVFLYVFNPNYMLMGLSMMRQFLVMLIGLYALEQATKRNFLRFLLLVAVGFTIHKVAVLLLPLYFLPIISTWIATKWWISVVVLVGFYLVIQNMSGIIEQLSMLIMESGTKYASSYLNNSVLQDDNKLGLKYIIHYVVYFIVLIRNLKYLNSQHQIFAVDVLLGLFIIPFTVIFPMALRTSWMYTVAEIISFPLLIKQERIPIIKYGMLMIMIAITLLFEYRGLFNSEIYADHFRTFQTIFSI